MDSALVRLRDALPPPKELAEPEVNWPEVESKLGLRFPTSFKEYIGIYGGCSNWFDLYNVFYPDPRTKIDEYIQHVTQLLKTLAKARITDDDCTLYPEPGGLFPFITSSDGDYYFWETKGENPDLWPIMVWQMPGLFPLTPSTIAGVFLKTLEEFEVSQPDRLYMVARGPQGYTKIWAPGADRSE